MSSEGSLKKHNKDIVVSRWVVRVLVVCCTLLVISCISVAFLAAMLITAEQQNQARHAAFCSYLSGQIVVDAHYSALAPQLSVVRTAFSSEEC